MKQKIDTKLGVIIIVIIAITVGMFVWKYEEKQKVGEVQNQIQEKNQKETNKIESANIDTSKPFQYSKGIGFYGTLALNGYVDIKRRICMQGDMCNKTVDYVFFVITSTDNNSIYDFIKENNGNSFVSSNGIGLGCYEKSANRIYSENIGDNGKVENIISDNKLNTILKSNKNKIIKIQLTKPNFTGGGGTSECYSHFRQFEIN